MQTAFFTGKDIDAMFSLFDPTGGGHISHDQYQNGEGCTARFGNEEVFACGIPYLYDVMIVIC